MAELGTVGELKDRRARKKAQTREHVLRTAQQLFTERGFEAVTIADVAASADVAVQTVFNHFATKEDLFFSERTPWVEGPAEAVRSRSPELTPLGALRGYLVGLVESYMLRAGAPEHRRMMARLQESPALLAYERLLHHEAESRLAEALAEACGESPSRDDGDPFVPAPARLAAALVAAVWLAAVRAVLLEQRTSPPRAGDTAAVQDALRLTEDLLDRLERTLPLRPGASAQAGSRKAIRRAG